MIVIVVAAVPFAPNVTPLGITAKAFVCDVLRLVERERCQRAHYSRLRLDAAVHVEGVRVL